MISKEFPIFLFYKFFLWWKVWFYLHFSTSRYPLSYTKKDAVFFQVCFSISLFQIKNQFIIVMCISLWVFNFIPLINVPAFANIMLFLLLYLCSITWNAECENSSPSFVVMDYVSYPVIFVIIMFLFVYFFHMKLRLSFQGLSGIGLEFWRVLHSIESVYFFFLVEWSFVLC